MNNLSIEELKKLYDTAIERALLAERELGHVKTLLATEKWRVDELNGKLNFRDIQFDSSKETIKSLSERNEALNKELIAIRELKGDQVPFRYMAEWSSQYGGMEYDYSEVRSEMDEVAAEHDGSVIELFTAPQKPVVLPDYRNADFYSHDCTEFDPLGYWIAVKAAIEAAGGTVKSDDEL